MNRRQRRRRAMLRKALLAGPPILAAVLWLIGLALPAAHREAVVLVVSSSAETVWAVLTDLDGMPDWRGDLAGLERLPSGDTGVRWREVGRRGSAAFEWVESTPPSRLVVREVGERPGRVWTYQIVRSTEGAHVILTEDSRIDNPLRRSVAGIFGADRSRIKGLARDLGRRLNGRRQFAAAIR